MANLTLSEKAEPDATPQEASAAAPAQVEVESPVAEAAEQIGRTINVQTVFLGIIAGLLVLYTFYIARTVVMPVVLACMLNLVLTPVVLALARVRIPAPAGAALVVFVFLFVLGLGIATLAEPAAEWLRRLPYVIDQLSDRLDFVQAPAEAAQESRRGARQSRQRHARRRHAGCRGAGRPHCGNCSSTRPRGSRSAR